MRKLFKTALVYLLIVLATVTLAKAGGGRKVLLEWLTPEEMYSRYQKEPRPVLVDVYTDWCHFCKVMDNKTWKNDSVAAYVNSHFYAVKINAENKQPYNWMGEQYEYDAHYKVNKLAFKLLQGKMAYPSTVIIPVKGGTDMVQGAFSAKEVELILKFYGDGYNENSTPAQFQRKFKGTWK